MNLFKGIKVFIGPSTFGAQDPRPLNCLKDAGFEIVENIYKRRLTKEELLKFLKDDIVGLIAGLETIDQEVLEKTNLKVISRCGAGISNVDFQAAKEVDIPAYQPALNMQERIWRRVRYEATTNRWFDDLEDVWSIVQKTKRSWSVHKIKRLCNIT